MTDNLTSLRLAFSIILVTCFAVFEVVVSLEQCQFDQLKVYIESCPGSEPQFSCLPGEKKARPCLGADRPTPTCVPCEGGSFQDKPNNCTECRPCSECPEGQRVSQACSAINDTICEPEVISTTPDVVQRQDDVSMQSLITSAAPNNNNVNDDPQGGGIYSSTVIVIAMICVIIGLIIGMMIRDKRCRKLERMQVTSQCSKLFENHQPRCIYTSTSIPTSLNDCSAMKVEGQPTEEEVFQTPTVPTSGYRTNAVCSSQTTEPKVSWHNDCCLMTVTQSSSLEPEVT